MSVMKPNNLLDYLAVHTNGSDDPDRVPPLDELSAELEVSISKLREQLEVARMLGLVEVKPRTGIRRKPYSFTPAVTGSLLYAVARDRERFVEFSDLRVRLETAYWREAVAALTAENVSLLETLVQQAWAKLNGSPITIPHAEHRRLHLTIFSRLENPFVTGLLEAYWAAYEAVELNAYADLAYLREVWTYHERIVQAIAAGDPEASLAAFIEHTTLLRTRA
jgi:DNA-binding FadR family transcriptional regulator